MITTFVSSLSTYTLCNVCVILINLVSKTMSDHFNAQVSPILKPAYRLIYIPSSLISCDLLRCLSGFSLSLSVNISISFGSTKGNVIKSNLKSKSYFLSAYLKIDFKITPIFLVVLFANLLCNSSTN